jgi:hypothetical protein
VLVATSPTVEVVTAGTDWAAIAAAIATGIAASIGIFGTAWQASHARQAATADLEKSINAAAQNLHASNEAEDRRALRAEKMRVYSEFQGEIDNILVSVRPDEEKKTVAALYRAAVAVTLIAPDAIGALASDMAKDAGSIADALVSPMRGDQVSRNREKLYRMMRSDLGTDSRPRGLFRASVTDSLGTIPGSPGFFVDREAGAAACERGRWSADRTLTQ